MIDPTSIATVAAAAVGACRRVSQRISSFMGKVENEDITLRVLRIEIDSLAGVFGSISVKFSDSATTTVILQSLVGCEEEYWRNVKRSMSDCEVTLQMLENVLRSINQGGLRTVRRGFIESKLEQRRGEIGLLKQQITTYHKTMELSLELIKVSLQLRDTNLTKSLSIRLDDMASEITHLLEWFEQPQVIIHGGSTHGMSNLRVCVSSAKVFVSNAIGILSTRPTDTDSRRSEHADMTDQRRNEISYWLRKHNGSDAIEEGTQQGSAGSVTTVNNTFDREHANLLTLLKFSREAYLEQNFEEAKRLLQNFRKRSEVKYGQNFDERNEVLGMLATIYCRLGDWKRAEEIVHTNFDGQESAIKSLVFSYWDHCRWNDAERILLEIADSDAEHEMDCEYTLAELYLVRGNHDKAIKSCDRLLRILEKDHKLFYLTISLLAQIYEAKGDVFEARIHRDLLPPGTELCQDIEKLSRMWPDQAATEAQSMWLSTFLHFEDPVPWDEIKANIAYGNIAGSGYGYTILHAFVELGNQFAVRFLIQKGADINAKTKSNGFTPLHLAIEKHNSSMVALLLDHDADHLAQDSKGMTAWALAIYHGDEKAVNALVARGVDVNEPASGTTNPVKPIMLAIEYGKENIVELLVKCGAQIEAMDGNGNTALINAAKNPSRVATVKRFLELGANVNACNSHGVTPLMAGVKSGSDEMVSTLLDKRPNLEARSNEGDTALLIASRGGIKEIVILLLEHGAECVVGYPRGATPQDVAANYSVMEPLQQARMKKKKWFHRFARDQMDDRYRSVRLAEMYKVYEEREKRERRQFTYVQTDEDMVREERETEEFLRRMKSVKM